MKTLKKQAQALARDAQAIRKAQTSAARKEAKRLQNKADLTLAGTKELKQQARLEDLHVWEMKKEKRTKKGSETYFYWMASWREGQNVRNVYLGSCKKLSRADAVEKARKLKAKSLGLVDHEEGLRRMESYKILIHD